MMVRYGVGSAVAAALLLTIVSAAQAGDAAARRIIGFSPDGRYFAFEQYGELDAAISGWSQIDIIDTSTDDYVGGKPILVLDESEEATTTLEQARAQAAKQAAPILPNMPLPSAANAPPSTGSPSRTSWSSTTTSFVLRRPRRNG